MNKKLNQIYRVVRLDDSEEVPFDFIFKTDAASICTELNRCIDLNQDANKTYYHIKNIIKS